VLAGRKQPINDVKKSKYSREELDDTKGVIRIRISKKNVEQELLSLPEHMSLSTASNRVDVA
jgi:hypothetical protein